MATLLDPMLKELAEKIVDNLDREFSPLKVTVLTGAGVSTDSGLPDFRGREGLWTGKTDLMELLSADGARKNPDEFTAFCRLAIKTVDQYQPNITHRVLAELQRAGLIGSIITQNVDGYHQAAGATNVVEVHGSLRRIFCQRCKKSATVEQFMLTDRCWCRGRLRSDIILFGEGLPNAALMTAIEAFAEAELLLIMGSTLVVDPIAQAPLMVASNGGRVAVLNGEPTAWDELASYTVYDQLSNISSQLYSHIHKLCGLRFNLPPLDDLT